MQLPRGPPRHGPTRGAVPSAPGRRCSPPAVPCRDLPRAAPGRPPLVPVLLPGPARLFPTRAEQGEPLRGKRSGAEAAAARKHLTFLKSGRRGRGGAGSGLAGEEGGCLERAWPPAVALRGEALLCLGLPARQPGSLPEPRVVSCWRSLWAEGAVVGGACCGPCRTLPLWLPGCTSSLQTSEAQMLSLATSSHRLDTNPASVCGTGAVTLFPSLKRT